MNEFDLRKFLYNNPLLEGEEADDKAKKALDKKEDELDEKDMENETLKDKIKHHEGAIKNITKELEDLKDDLGEDEEDLKKEKEEMKEGMDDTYEEDDNMKEGMGKSYYEDDDKKKMTKEGLKSMIREKITSILTEQEDDEVDVDVQNKVDVKDKEEVDVDVEKEKEVDDVSKETDIDVKTSLPGESEDVDAVLGLLTKASEEADRFSDDPELKTQIGNTITYFTRKHIAKPTNEGEEMNEKLLGLMSDVPTGGTLGIGTDRGGLIFSKLGKGRYKLTGPTSHPSFRQGEIWKPRQDEKNLRVGQSLGRLGDIEGLRVDGESKQKVKT